jgi:hypothetical protein
MGVVAILNYKTLKNVNAISKLSFALLFAGITAAASAQNLDALPKAKRDSLLIAKATQVVKKHGPGYYREYKITVERDVVPPKGPKNPKGEYLNKATYRVIFYYDPTKERLDANYAASVAFWADTGELIGVMFGNTYGLYLDKTAGKQEEAEEEVTVIPYEAVKW